MGATLRQCLRKVGKRSVPPENVQVLGRQLILNQRLLNFQLIIANFILPSFSGSISVPSLEVAPPKYTSVVPRL